MGKQSNTTKVIKGISSQTLVTLVMGVMEIVIFSIMSRLLSKEDFGLYATVSAITLIFGSLSEAGIGSALIQKKDPDTAYVNTSFTISFILGSVFSLILIALSGVLSKAVSTQPLMESIMIMSITIFCNSLISVNRSIIHRRLEFLEFGIINLVALLLSSVIAIVMALKGWGFESIVTKVVINSILTTVLSYYLAKTKFKFQIDRTAIRSIVNFGGWLTLSVILRNFVAQIDKLLVSRFLSVSSLGAYNRPKEFIDTISSKLNGIFDTALFPILSGLQDKKESVKSAYHLSLYYMNIFSMLIAFGFIFNTNLIIRIFFGEEWLNLSTVFIILSISVIFNIDGRLCDCFFRSLALVKYQFYIRIFESILTIGCLFIGFKWDIIGVSIAVLISNITTIFVKLIVISSKVGSNFGSILKIILSSWRFALVIGPILVFSGIVLPKAFLGDLINLGVFIICNVVVFLILPSLVGVTYKDGLYKTVLMKYFHKLTPMQ